MQIFELNNQNTISNTTLNDGKPLGFYCINFSENRQGAIPHTPLNSVLDYCMPQYSIP